ncbi:MAG: helix-turn-helix transcriptional regulator [Anaerolineales bacterium]|nr:helix-turn-helix transcriptional regulator [Anaerolineales bacterium]
MKPSGGMRQVASVLKTISHPSRLAILLAIGNREICVHRLQTLLGGSQSHISQQLMALRRAGVVCARRQNRFVHYRLADPRLLGLIRAAARLKRVGLPKSPAAWKGGCPDRRGKK